MSTIIGIWLTLAFLYALWVVCWPVGLIATIWFGVLIWLSNGEQLEPSHRGGRCCVSCGKRIPAAMACTFCESGQPLD